MPKCYGLLASARAIAFALSLAAGVGAAAAQGFQKCPQFFVAGAVPQVLKSPAADRGPFRELCFDAFAVLHSGDRKTPVYTVERLSRAQLIDAKDEQRSDHFYPEARLPDAQRATLEDYRGSGFDRGHMSPAADQPTAAAMAQSFSLANMVPQAPQNNRKAWAGIEKSTRKYVMRAQGDVFVFSGPWGVKARIGARGVAVPSHLYKLVYDATSHRAWAYWIANEDSARVGPPISYQELVSRTGISFLPGLVVED